MKTPCILAACWLCLAACSSETRPAASPPINSDQQNPVPPAGPAPAAPSPNSEPNMPTPQSEPPDKAPQPSSRFDVERSNAGNLIAAPARLSAGDEELLFVPSDRLRDFRITEEIRRELAADPILRAAVRRVDIHTVDGEVTVRGVVSSLAERVAVVQAARRVAGEEHVGAWIEIKR